MGEMAPEQAEGLRSILRDALADRRARRRAHRDVGYLLVAVGSAMIRGDATTTATALLIFDHLLKKFVDAEVTDRIQKDRARRRGDQEARSEEEHETKAINQLRSNLARLRSQKAEQQRSERPATPNAREYPMTITPTPSSEKPPS